VISLTDIVNERQESGLTFYNPSSYLSGVAVFKIFFYITLSDKTLSEGESDEKFVGGKLCPV